MKARETAKFNQAQALNLITKDAAAWADFAKDEWTLEAVRSLLVNLAQIQQSFEDGAQVLQDEIPRLYEDQETLAYNRGRVEAFHTISRELKLLIDGKYGK